MNSLDLWLQATVNGIALGWLYVLMALGLTLILSIMGILQLAHGEIYMLGAFATYYFVGRGFGFNKLTEQVERVEIHIQGFPFTYGFSRGLALIFFFVKTGMQSHPAPAASRM